MPIVKLLPRDQTIHINPVKSTINKISKLGTYTVEVITSTSTYCKSGYLHMREINTFLW